MLLNNGKKRIPIGYEDFKQIIDGQIYYVAPPSRVHQKISGKLYQIISNYIDSKPPCPALAPLRMKQGPVDCFYFFCHIDDL